MCDKGDFVGHICEEEDKGDEDNYDAKSDIETPVRTTTRRR